MPSSPVTTAARELPRATARHRLVICGVQLRLLEVATDEVTRRGESLSEPLLA